MNKDDVVSVIALGAEYVGKLEEVKENSIVLNNPVMVMVTEQGMGFAASLAMTGEENPKQVELRGYTLATKTNSQVEAGYRQHTSGLITKPKTGLIV